MQFFRLKGRQRLFNTNIEPILIRCYNTIGAGANKSTII